jgi:hypothetical protein
MDAEAASKLEKGLNQWHHEWQDVGRDFEDIERRYSKHYSRGMTANGNATPSSFRSCNDRSTSPEPPHRSRIIIRRGGLIRRIDADPFSSEESDDASSHEEQKSGETEGVPPINGHITKSTDDNDGSLDTTNVADEGSEDEDTKAKRLDKTPWQELWHSLAEYAGMHNYDDE